MLAVDDQLAIQKKLDEKFREGRMRNPAYSLRSFAKRVGISSSALSEIINGKRRVSRKMAVRITSNLKLSDSEASAILDLFPMKRSKADEASAYMKHLQLSVDQFRVISDWYHFAILSLLNVHDFSPDPKWISERINISIAEVKMAIERLLRLELIAEKDGTLLRTHVKLKTPDNIMSSSIQKSHIQHFELAKQSLVFDDVHERDFTSMTMAIDPNRIDEAKTMIRRFHERMCGLLETGKQTSVYKLSVQLFPLSHDPETQVNSNRGTHEDH